MEWFYCLMACVACVQSLMTSRAKQGQERPWHITLPTSQPRKLNVVTVLAEPYVMLRVSTSFYVGNERFEGFLVDVIEALCTALNVEYELRLAEDGILGTVDRHGNWSGLVGELQRGEADMAAAPLVVSRDLESVVDFTVPYLTFKSTALVRKVPPPLAVNHAVDVGGRRGDPARSIRTPADLLSSNLTYGLLGKSVTQSDLQGSTNQLHQRLWSRIVTFWPSTIADSLAEGLQRVRQDALGFAFLVDTATAEYVTSRPPCDVYTTEPFLDTHAYALAVRRQTDSLRHQVDEKMGKLIDSYVIQRLYLKWWHSHCPLPRQAHPHLPIIASRNDPRNHDIEIDQETNFQGDAMTSFKEQQNNVTSTATRKRTLAAHRRADRTVSERFYGDSNPQDAEAILATNSVNDVAEAMHYHTKQSRRLPQPFYRFFCTLLGIKRPDDENERRPWVGYVTYGVTVVFALMFLVTFAWYEIAAMLVVRSKETVLTGLMSIGAVLYWTSLSMYGRVLVARILSFHKFVDSVRMHSKSILKLNAAILFVVISVAALVANNYDTVGTFSDHHCEHNNISVPVAVCKLMYISRVGCSFFTLLWNVTIGIVLLSVCRTHTIGIRRFIRQMELDGQIYQLIKMKKISQQMQPQRHQSDRGNVDGTYYLWDDDITPLSEDWQFLHPRLVTREFSDSLRARHGDIETYPQRQGSSSSGGKHTAAPSRGNHGGIVNVALESGGAGNDGDISDSVIDDDDDALIINEDRDQRDEIDRSVSNRVPELLPPMPQGVDGGARGDGSSTSAAAAASAPFSSELIYRTTDSESLSSAEIRPQTRQRSQLRNNSSVSKVSPRAMSLDEIMLCYWRIQKRLLVTTLAFQRWTIAWLLFIIIWGVSFILMWLRQRAQLVEILQFAMPALIVPLLCSAYAEVNFEGQRLLQSIFPSEERIGMVSLFVMQPLALNTYGFMLNYSTIVTFLSAVALAACTRIIIDELSQK